MGKWKENFYFLILIIMRNDKTKFRYVFLDVFDMFMDTFRFQNFLCLMAVDKKCYF